ncbi:CheR family methyltransferase [Xanthobacter sp. DSM 24535]|uniref:CheR family methyltransferase n=1 Tax=Roseixanthobacter psychrophilus TaxID=3119917 RepID=UPI00372B57B0
MKPEPPAELEAIEVDLFVEAMRRRHGYDFSGYGKASLTRRIRNLVTTFGTGTISRLTDAILHEPARLPQVISGLSVPVSEFFRDAASFGRLRTEVFPALISYPQVNIWQAGCARGEEVYSLAILLTEAGLYGRTRIYATDISPDALARAQAGIFPARDLRDAAGRYLAAGGIHSLSDYYHARYEFAKVDSQLMRNIAFAEHNLVTDGVFCEAHLILCRNVLIYFTTPLQNRAIQVFADSLVRTGFLCVGARENLALAPARERFQLIDGATQLYRLKPTY